VDTDTGVVVVIVFVVVVVVSQEFLVNDVDGIIHTVYYIINFFYTVYNISISMGR
jgi:hypothetical protein